MTYPISSDVTAGQPTAASHYNSLRADALRLGQAEGDVVRLGQLLGRYEGGVRLQYLATNRLRVPYVTTEPPTLMINGCMCQAGAHVDLAAGMFSGGAAIWYVFANRTPGSTTFTLSVNTSASEGADQRIIGEAYWDGSALVRVKDYFGSPLGDPDYESGWFAVAYNNAYTRAHSLAQVPKLVVIEHADNGSGTGELVPVLINYAADYKSPVGYDASNIYFNAQNNTAFGVLISTRRSSGGGYLRMRAWK